MEEEARLVVGLEVVAVGGKALPGQAAHKLRRRGWFQKMFDSAGMWG